MRKPALLALSFCLCVWLVFSGANIAHSLTIDQIIFEPGGDSTVLAGTVDASLLGSTLTLIVTNTSTAHTGGDDSTNVLSGVGFNLPTDVTISGGTVSMTGAMAVNFTAPGGGDVSSEWGYDNDVTSGPFQNVTTLDVNTAVAALQAATDVKFASGFILDPEVLNGPEFGLVSDDAVGDLGNGLAAIQDFVTISLTLAGLGSLPGDFDLLGFIESNPVVLAFGSPTEVPEAGSLLLLACGLMAIAVLRTRVLKKAEVSF